MSEERDPAAETAASEAAAEALNQPTPEPKPEAPAAEAAPGPDAAAPGPEGEAEKPKPKTAQERIDEITGQKHEATRRAEAAEAELERIRAARKPAEEPEPKKNPDGRPDPEDYDFGIADEKYLEDLTDWKAEQAVQKALGNRDAASSARQAVTSFRERATKAFPDGEPAGLKAYRALDKVPAAVQDVVLVSEVGHKIAEHLGANQPELTRLAGLSPTLQAYELGKLETRFSTATPPPNNVSQAPEPPNTTARGAGGRFSVPADTDDFAAFDKQYG
jgi:hypothetical protein